MVLSSSVIFHCAFNILFLFFDSIMKSTFQLANGSTTFCFRRFTLGKEESKGTGSKAHSNRMLDNKKWGEVQASHNQIGWKMADPGAIGGGQQALAGGNMMRSLGDCSPSRSNKSQALTLDLDFLNQAAFYFRCVFCVLWESFLLCAPECKLWVRRVGF